MYGKGLYIFKRIAALVFVLLMAIVVAVQTPYVQTRLSKIALNQLAAVMDGRVQYDELKVMTSGVLVIRNLRLLDTNPYTEDINGRGWAPADTVLHVGKITSTFSIASLIRRQGLHMGRVTVEDALFHLVAEPGEYGNNIARIFHLGGLDTEFPQGDIFDIKKIRVKNFRFRMNSFLPDAGTYTGSGLNFDDIDANVELLTAHGIRMSGGKIYATLDRCQASEKSGYEIDRLSAIAEVSEEKILVEDLRFSDPWSDVSVRSFSMSYDSFEALSDILSKVRIEADVLRSQIAVETFSFFVPELAGNPTVIDLRRGQVKGFVNDLQLSRIQFTERHSGISGSLDGTIVGLPDIQNLMLDVQLKDIQATTAGANKLARAFVGKGLPDLSQYARGIPLTLQLSARGPIGRLTYAGSLTSPAGDAQVSGDVRNLLDETHPIEIDAAVQTRELDLGRFLGNDMLGPATLSTNASAVLRPNRLPDARLDSLVISKIHALGRDFGDIHVSGVLRSGTAELSVLSKDPAVMLDLSGLADLTARNGGQRVNLDGTLTNIDLRAFGIDGGTWVSRLSTRIHTDLTLNGEYADGEATLESLRLVNDSGTHPIGDIHLLARTNGSEQNLSVDASFLEAYFTGNRPVTHFIPDLEALTTRRELSALYTDDTYTGTPGRYTLELLFHDTRDILEQFLPGVYIADGTSASLSVSDEGDLDGFVQSDRIASGKNFLKDIALQFDNRDNMLFATLVSQELRAGGFAMNAPTITASAEDNDFALSVHYDGFSTAGGGNGEIYLDGQLYRDPDGVLVVKAHPLNSYLVAGDDTWTLNESDIVLHGKNLFLDRFMLSNGDQRLLIDGGLSLERSDTLALVMDRFDLALVDQFLPQALGIEGSMNGKAYVTSGKDEPLGMLMDFSIDTLRVGGADAGTLRLSSMWNHEGKELGLFVRDEIEGRDALAVSGSFFPTDNKIDLHVDLDQLPLTIASPFLAGLATDVGGGVSGSLTLAGPLDAPVPGSQDLRIENATARVAMTGVAYTLSGPVRVEPDGVYLDDLELRDDSSGYGRISGALRYNSLTDFDSFRIETRVSFNNLKVVDTPEQPGGLFYGLLRSSGAAAVSGPFSSLLIDADVASAGLGDIHIPLSGIQTSTASDLLTFTEPVRELDPYEEMLAQLEQRTAKKSDIRIRGHITVHPTVETHVEIDKAAGNVASFNGAGSFSVNVQPSRDILELNGDYTINEGNYQFVVPGVLSKTFSVQRGSSVKFVGDIMNTLLDLTAGYSTKAPLNTLIGGDSTGSRRTVECTINVTDRLSAPQIDLNIDIADLDPTTRSQVEAALNTSDKVQKQFVALLLMGSFLPSEASGISNQTNSLFSNVVSVLTSQFNNILQKLDIPVDVAVGYQENASGQDLFDVSVSTQLFENRVIVGGSFGNRRFSTGSAAGDFTGDLDIQVKLDTLGKFRFNVFSHSADEFTNYLDYSQRNGVGISYQKEYNSFGDFLRSIFTSKKKREQREREEALKDNEPIVIVIDSDEPEEDEESGETVPDPDSPGGE